MSEYKSFFKTVGGNEGTLCKYPTRLDTYEKGSSAMSARGIRNNNPGNIRLGCEWKGLRAEQTDPAFCQFETMAMGCRALLKTLRTYVEKYDLRTVRRIILRWAPSIENDSESYIRHVATAIRHDADELLNFHDDQLLYLDIARAIARHECGSEAESAITSDDWEVAWKEAGL